jgi:predicted MFS family arabinose efflux permease
MVVGYFLAGWLNQIYGWRVAFMALGFPGIAFALLSWFTLREPRRERLAHADSRWSVGQPNLRAAFLTLGANRTFRQLLLGFSVCAFFSAGITQWQPTFFIRSYGLNTSELGLWLALIYGLGSLLGTYIGGELASRYAAHNERLQLRVMAAVYTSFAAITPLVYLSSNRYLGFACLGFSAVGASTTAGPLYAAIQTLVPSRLRALAIAGISLFANLIGMGLGPLVVGVLSDGLTPAFGDESLRYALLALCPGYVWAGWHIWCASKSVTSDLQRITDVQRLERTHEHRECLS